MADTDIKPGFRKPDGLKIVTRAGIGRRSLWFQAHQVRLDRNVALKFLRPQLAERPEFLEAFLEAGRQAAVMVHPAVLPIINVHPGHHCIVMQWCQGTPVARMAGSVDAFRTAFAGEVVMDCLSTLHATDRCHGNLTPGNIFIGDSGKVWINDFFQPPFLRGEGMEFKCDQRYIAPEVRLSGPDWRADVFSLGCVLDTALAGEERPRELAALIGAMRSPEPMSRGESPQAVHAAFRRIRLAEAARLGMTRDTIRRRRMYRRVPTEFAVELRRRSATPVETASILMKVRDIGESGVFVETDDELIGIGSILELDFTLKGARGNVHAFGVVRWKSEPPMPRGVGVQFVEVDREGLDSLRKFLGNK